MANPDPALNLLLLCLGNRSDTMTTGRFRQLPILVWERAAQLAQRHNVEALFYARLKNLNLIDSVPVDIRQTLRQATHLSALKLAGLYQELTSILHQLAHNSIPVIVLKGAYLGQIVYQNSATRSMSDIDILVHREDLSRATALMELRGYHLENGMWGTKHLTFMADDGRPPVEIHWHIIHPADPFTIDVEALWTRAVPVMLTGTSALAFSPEDLILHIALHTSFSHGFRFGLRPFCDLHEIINCFGDVIEWQPLIHRAHNWQITHALFLTLRLTMDLLSTAVPDAQQFHLWKSSLVNWCDSS